MPIITCKKCGKPSRFAELTSSVRCPHCQETIEPLANATKLVPAPAVVPPPKPKPVLQRENTNTESPPKSADPGIEPTELTAASELTAFPTPTDSTAGAASSPSVRELLPPRYVDETFLKRLLPPKFSSEGRGINSVISRQTKGKILIPDGQGGFAEVDERIVYVNSNGERVPIELTDRRTQWRQRAIFNLIAMLICLTILYLCFLFIVPR